MAVAPDFLVIGVAKSATTALCDTLRCHPDVFVSTPNEPRYWCRKGHELYKTPEWYAALFADAPTGSLRGEGSTRSTNPEHAAMAARRMAAAIPDARLICLVRHPIARLESDWKMRAREG